MKLVCIPAFDEEKTIGDVVKRSLKYADKVIVCDDSSKDNTAKIARQSELRLYYTQKTKAMVQQSLHYLLEATLCDTTIILFTIATPIMSGNFCPRL